MYGTSGDWGKTWGGIITSIINSVQIQILNTVYKKVAVALTGELKGSSRSRRTGEALPFNNDTLFSVVVLPRISEVQSRS